MSTEAQQNRITDYLEMLRSQRQLSSHSVESYRLDLAELLKFAGESDLTDISHHQIRRFTSQLHAQDLNPRSIARKLSCWRGFYRWLAEQTTMIANPVDGIKPPKKSKSLPKALGTDDAVRLVSQHRSDTATQAANRAMFELLYSSGLRVSELVALDALQSHQKEHSSQGWVDMQQAEVHVTGKGNKQRIVPVGRPALEAIKTWLAIRPTLLKADPHPLFLSERGSRISVRLVQLRIKAHAQSLGIPADVSPHVMRHSFASHVLQSSGDLRAVQEMLGHSSIAATQIYTSLDFQHLAKVYDQAHPRAKK
ncbi:tyrosine recombinase XerC [Undibacterium sp. 5I1]|uniref:tyrosine recombinase XerC n=1 Tax=unclassified Undibacterium TaxID=2630295 RepID=UPI002AB4DEF0|nr:MULTISPECIES: tyrosine recombinase XerC [unclassified Undibacterium]MDY7540042.1 tyrosine recombinase XerC [Undibacterium sp. 5I1]MEB0232964.1 tyrosine recombinase XerC [Undibacterium sp. 10I3]MEB0257889.1 tyrosine recombinase XerC [Undibacterium sp. 5I1]